MKNLQPPEFDPRKSLDQSTLESLGRWLCVEFYRDSRELQRVIGVHEINDVFGAIIQLDTAFGELLAGGYRYNQLRVLGSREGSVVKWIRFGEPVVGRWKDVPSIDGIGVVRAKEVLLYILVAEEFIRRCL